MKLRIPSPTVPERLGEADGITAGRGIADGLGDTERRRFGAAWDPNEDLRLCEVGGGYIGKAKDCGVPGADGLGEPMLSDNASCTNDAR